MAIDIKKIEEITFTQSFRGYNTDEVDDYLDEIYEQAVNAKKEILDLKAKIEELEKNGGTTVLSDDGANIIADAQQTADQIIAKATQKAQEIITQAQNISSKEVVTEKLDDKSIEALKKLAEEMYQKQMIMINSIAVDNKEDKTLSFEKADDTISFEKVRQPVNTVQTQKSTISFAGIVNKAEDSIENAIRESAPKDIFSEMNSIGLNGFKSSKESNSQQEPFAEMPDKQEPIIEKKPESPDDIIAQILRDNNRN